MDVKKDYISIIVPIYNEEKNIENLIDNLERLNGNFEVIFLMVDVKIRLVRLLKRE